MTQPWPPPQYILYDIDRYAEATTEQVMDGFRRGSDLVHTVQTENVRRHAEMLRLRQWYAADPAHPERVPTDTEARRYQAHLRQQALGADADYDAYLLVRTLRDTLPDKADVPVVELWATTQAPANMLRDEFDLEIGSRFEIRDEHVMQRQFERAVKEWLLSKIYDHVAGLVTPAKEQTAPLLAARDAGDGLDENDTATLRQGVLDVIRAMGSVWGADRPHPAPALEPDDPRVATVRRFGAAAVQSFERTGTQQTATALAAMEEGLWDVVRSVNGARLSAREVAAVAEKLDSLGNPVTLGAGVGTHVVDPAEAEASVEQWGQGRVAVADLRAAANAWLVKSAALISFGARRYEDSEVASARAPYERPAEFRPDLEFPSEDDRLAYLSAVEEVVAAKVQRFIDVASSYSYEQVAAVRSAGDESIGASIGRD